MPLRIWAPRAHRLDVLVGETRTPATQGSGGWWHGPDLAEGDRYALSIDGGAPRPDPRSPWQPDGVNGASCWLQSGMGAHRAFRQAPLRDAVIYELHVGTFSEEGTFEGAIAHLDHLVELGVTHL